MQISASQITKLGKSYFTIPGDSLEESEESVIPFHRILEIRNVSDGRVIWIKRRTESAQR